MTTNQRLDRLFDRWRQRRANFVADGVISESESHWRGQPVRFLVLCREPHNRNNVCAACGFDLRVLFRFPERYPQKATNFERTAGKWLFDIRATCGYPAPSPQEAWRSAAVMNLKKSYGGKSHNERELRAVVREDADLIKEEIAILDPHVIICGGTFKYLQSLYRFERRWDFAYAAEHRIWLDYHHPSSWTWQARHEGIVKGLR